MQSTDILDLAKSTFVPAVCSKPTVVIWQINWAPALEATVQKALYEILPLYWSQDGIIDCKVLFSPESQSALCIESWLSPYNAQHVRECPEWASLFSELTLRGCSLRTLADNTFELIE